MQRRISAICMLVVLAAALAVIAGWHLRVEFLVGIMIYYVWQMASPPLTVIPSRTPLFATVAAPFLFTGHSVGLALSPVTAHSLEFIAGIVFIVLLAIGFYRITGSKVAVKGLILISVPLVFVLMFVALVVQMKTETERAQRLSIHAKNVSAQGNSLLRDVTEAETSLQWFLMTRNPKAHNDFDNAAQRIQGSVETLKTLVRRNKEQSARADRLAVDAMQELATMESMAQSESAAAPAQAAKLPVERQSMADLRAHLDDFLSAEEKLDASRQESLRVSWQHFNWLLAAGASADVLLTLALLFLFSRGITRRIKRLEDNAQLFAAGQEMGERMEGSDELAHLDGVFHHMAASLDNLSRQQQAVMDNTLDVICSIDSKGRFVKVNQAALKLWGYQPSELVGRPCLDLVVPDDRERTRKTAEDIIAGLEVRDFQNSYTRKDGSIVCLMWSASWSEKEHLMFAVARDITEHKEKEERIRLLNEDLQRHAHRLEQTNQELESFTYSVSHDLRAPLRHIDGFAELLDKSSGSVLSDNGRRYLKTISESARQMGRLIDDLLAFSRMGRKEMLDGCVDLNEIVSETRDSLVTETEGRSIHWKIGQLPLVKGDPVMLRQVVVNLMSNAVKYTGKKTDADIEVGSANGQPDKVVIFVKDNGVGFDMKYSHKLFGVFQRLHRPDEFKGTGIGLASVRRIVRRHGGDAWAEGALGEGATFYFSLPKEQKG